MEKIVSLTLMLVFVGICNGQIINFPDVNFKNKVIADGHDTNNDGEIQISEAEAVTDLRVTSLSGDPNKITDMTGIEHFVNLIELRCGGNLITSLDATPLTQLELLYADYNELTSIDVTGLTALSSLWVFNNQLTSIDISSLTNLWWIYCTDNQLTGLDLSGNPNLEAIWASENNISTIDLSNNPLLEFVHLEANNISNIEVNFLDNLLELLLTDNLLTSIDVSNMPSLGRLYVGYNDIDIVDLSETGVYEIHCDENPNLTYINAQNNVISTSDPDLLYFGFSFANLPSLEVICMDPGEEYALSESGYDPNSVIVTSQPDCSLSVDEFSSNSVVLFPNPVKDSFTIQSEVPIQKFILLSATGSQIVQTTDHKTLEDTVVSLSSGFYFIEVFSDMGDQLTLKFLKD